MGERPRSVARFLSADRPVDATAARSARIFTSRVGIPGQLCEGQVKWPPAPQERRAAGDTREASHAEDDAPYLRSVLEHLTAVHWTALAAAVAFQVSKLLARSRAWHNLLCVAFPGSGLRWRSTVAAVLVSAGVNTTAPSRIGDVVKVAVVRRGLGGRCCLPTVGATMLVEAAADAVLAVAVVGGVVVTGRLVAPGAVGGALSGVVGRPWVVAGIGLGGCAVVAPAIVAARRRAAAARRFLDGVRRGLAGLRDPRWYVTAVGSWQALSWLLRIGCVFFALRAFGVEATPTVALLVVAAQILSGVVPVAGGAGVQQALFVVALNGYASVGAAVVFSVGLQVTVALTNVALTAGIVAVVVPRLGIGGVRALAVRRPVHVPEPIVVLVDAAAA